MNKRDYNFQVRNVPVTLDGEIGNLIVKAMSEAINHTREVVNREHIKADRIERVNQFIVSLRRQFGYIDDVYKCQREYLSAQLAQKKVWYDIGVLNPTSINGLDQTILRSRNVENWLAQAEAMTPAYGDLKAEIEHDLQKMKGSILVAESCNKTVGELNRNADKVLSEMAALAEEIEAAS